MGKVVAHGVGNAFMRYFSVTEMGSTGSLQTQVGYIGDNTSRFPLSHFNEDSHRFTNV